MKIVSGRNCVVCQDYFNYTTIHLFKDEKKDTFSQVK